MGSSVYIKSTDIFWNNTSMILVDLDEERNRVGFKHQLTKET